MIDMENLLNLQVTFFLLIAAGYIMAKIGLLNPAARQGLNDLLINFVLPCNIIVSFMIELSSQILLSCLAVLLVSCGIQLFGCFFGRMLYPFGSAEQRTVLHYGTLCSNAMFLGNPVVEGLYGSQGLLYASIYLIPQRIMNWSFGVSCFTGTRGKNVLRRVLTHPCIIAVAIGLTLMLTQYQPPEAIVLPLRYANNCTTALSMIVIGGILSEVEVRSIFSRATLWYCLMRLIVIPLLVLLVCRLIGLDGLVTGVSVVLAGMPAAATTAILAAKYNCDAHFATKIVFLSTMLSLVTIPLLCILMEAV